MPLELGIFLGAKFLGSTKQKQKMCLVFDEVPFRYQKYLSDIAGQDISSHQNDPRTMAIEIRNWLASFSSEKLASGSVIWERYQRFQKELKGYCDEKKQKPEELTYNDYVHHVELFIHQKVDVLKTGYKNRWGNTLNDPSLSHIREAVKKLKGGTNSFVILTKSGGGFSFLQVRGSDKDGFDLEYQDGSTNDHYRCTDELTEEQVVAIFQAYRSGDESWKSKSVWERHKWW